MILITFVYLLTFVGIFDESTLLINRMGNIVFSEFFCKKKQDFYLLESNFQRVKHSARSSKAFDEYKIQTYCVSFCEKKHDPLKTLHLSKTSFTKYCFHSRFCTSMVFFELLHQCNYQGIKSTFKSTF